jgi:hypothetical protein
MLLNPSKSRIITGRDALAHRFRGQDAAATEDARVPFGLDGKID